MGIGTLAAEKSARIAEYKRRKVRWDNKLVPRTKVDEFVADGWSRAAELKTGTRVRREKPLDEVLENDFWMLLYLLGYQTLSVGRDFKIDVTDHGGQKAEKKIGVFAMDDETIVVARCECSDVRTKKKSLQKKLEEFEQDKGPIARALGAKFGLMGQKILWMFVTKNIEWNRVDIARAKEFNIRPVTELEMRYTVGFECRSDHALRGSARPTDRRFRCSRRICDDAQRHRVLRDTWRARGRSGPRSGEVSLLESSVLEWPLSREFAW